jgi:hypothetical protein
VNEAAQRAFNNVFHELAQSGIKLDPRLFDINPNQVSPFGTTASRRFKHYDDFAKFILQPFTHAELSNQAVTFFGSRHAMRRAMKTGEMDIPVGVGGKPLTGKAMDDWLDFEAGNVVNATQFRPGPGSRSIFQTKLPSPLRMFTSFPTRAASFMMDSTVRGALTTQQMQNAGMLEKIFGGRNWGTISRIALIGRIVEKGASEALGLDLSNALGVTSPFTIAPQGQPFAPVMLPPVAGTVTGLVSAAVNRDVKRMQPMHLPGVGEIPIPKSIVPGGVGMARMIRALNQWEPDLGGFVDEDRRLMYKGNSTDLILGMLGIPTTKQRRVREWVERSQDVRQRVTKFRRKYAVARMNYDTEEMNKLQGQWKEAFPDWGPLNIADRDLERYKANARIPMISRMVQSMGQSGRYLQREMFEVDPDVLAPPESPYAGLLE